MLCLGRCLSIVIALGTVLGLAAGCKVAAKPSPAATHTQTALRIVPSPEIVASDTSPVPTRTQDMPPSSTPAPSPTETATSTPILPTPTPTWTTTPSPMPLTSTPPPPPSPTRPPPTATPVPTATRTRLPPTATPSPYRFLSAGPAQPDPSHPCPGCPIAPAYIVGRVVDAAGSPLAGVRLVCYNEWHRYPVVASKGGGEYDIAINQAETTWYIVVLDQADQPISPEVAVHFDPRETCRYILDWRRVN